MERKRLSDIVRDGTARDDLARTWDTTAAAADLGPVPPGEYLARLLSGELFTARAKGTPGYKWTLEIAEGEHAGRRLWHDLWLTPAALPQAKIDLAKIGVVRFEQLEQPVPPGILLRVKVALHTGDGGTPYNRLTRIEAAGVEPDDPFAPGDAAAAGDDPDGGAELGQTADGATAFPFGANVPEPATSTPPAGAEPAPPTDTPPASADGGALPGLAPLPSRGRRGRGRPAGVNGEAAPYLEGR